MTIDSAVVRKKNKGGNAVQSFQKHQENLAKSEANQIKK